MSAGENSLEDVFRVIGAEREGGWVVGQMGQSLDGFIATRTGASHYVTGPESLVHLHRLRAWADAVVVGWRTVASDDPQLTVRLVDGTDPVRVIVDLRRTLSPGHRAFTAAGGALRIVSSEAPEVDAIPGIHELALPTPSGRVEPVAVLDALRAAGHRRVLIEGGGALVSGFLRAGALDRLHLVVAPLLIGEGRPGIQPTPVNDLGDALRPPAAIYPLGNDVLFDLDLQTGARRASTS